MEISSTFERPAADRGDDVRESLRDGIGLDGERKHQRLREGTPECKSNRAGRLFVESLAVFATSSVIG